MFFLEVNQIPQRTSVFLPKIDDATSLLKIFGKASQRISDKLVNAGFFLAGWSNGNQQARYNIRVTEEGWYNLILEFSEFNNESVYTAKVGNNAVSRLVKEKGKTDLRCGFKGAEGLYTTYKTGHYDG